jgi:hypothetical protein
LALFIRWRTLIHRCLCHAPVSSNTLISESLRVAIIPGLQGDNRSPKSIFKRAFRTAVAAHDRLQSVRARRMLLLTRYLTTTAPPQKMLKKNDKSG